MSGPLILGIIGSLVVAVAASLNSTLINPRRYQLSHVGYDGQQPELERLLGRTPHDRHELYGRAENSDERDMPLVNNEPAQRSVCLRSAGWSRNRADEGRLVRLRRSSRGRCTSRPRRSCSPRAR
jgi:hypothetical protein